jgi:hypothetical protein
MVAGSPVRAQNFRSSVETWGQTYRPAGLMNLEARSVLYPWVRAETQVWTGRPATQDDPTGDVVVLALQAREPLGRLALHAGRFVLSTGAVRPVHLDGAHVVAQTLGGTSAEVFSGVPVVPRFGRRSYDWLVGGRVAQRFGSFGVLGASYVERRDRGRETSEALGGDLALYLLRRLSMSARASYDLVSRDVAEVAATGALGSIERRLELYGTLRNAALLLPSTSLFSVLSDAPSVQTGANVRVRVAPRLSLDSLLGYRAQGDRHGVRAMLGGTLWLADDASSSLEGRLTRDGVQSARWTGLRTLLVRALRPDLRLMAELELVIPDRSAGRGSVWPWGRLSARYTLRERWHFSAGAEGSSSPQFVRLFQALMRVAYHFEAATP